MYTCFEFYTFDWNDTCHLERYEICSVSVFYKIWMCWISNGIVDPRENLIHAGFCIIVSVGNLSSTFLYTCFIIILLLLPIFKDVDGLFG